MHGINITIKAAKYYPTNQKVLREDARNKYRNLSEKEKNKRRKYQRERYHMNTNLNERLKQYQKNYYASKEIFYRPLCIILP